MKKIVSRRRRAATEAIRTTPYHYSLPPPSPQVTETREQLVDLERLERIEERLDEGMKGNNEVEE